MIQLFCILLLVCIISIKGFGAPPNFANPATSPLPPTELEQNKAQGGPTNPQVGFLPGTDKSNTKVHKPSYSTKKLMRQNKGLASAKKNKWTLFKWLHTNHFSLEWAYGFLDQEDKNLYAPPLLKEKITKNFKHEALLFLNYHHDIIRFPYLLDWGLRGSVGMARSYDIKSDYFFPLSLSGIVSLRAWKHQPLVPFVEGGLSSWNLNFSSDFSKILPFWTVGAFVSLSLFKSSLRYTFANDYGVNDIGFVLEWRTHLSPFQKEEKELF